MPKLSRVAKKRATVGKAHPALRQPALNLRYAQRTYCSAVEDMRRTIDHFMNLSAVDKLGNIMVPASTMYCLVGLTEEIQVYGNRMEAALGDAKDWNEARKQRKKLTDEVKKLKADYIKLGGTRQQLRELLDE